MTGSIGEWVLYHPPKSVSFGHQSKVRAPRKAWPMVAEFLASCAQLEFGHLAELTCYKPNKWTKATVAATSHPRSATSFWYGNWPCGAGSALDHNGVNLEIGYSICA